MILQRIIVGDAGFEPGTSAPVVHYQIGLIHSGGYVVTGLSNPWPVPPYTLQWGKVVCKNEICSVERVVEEEDGELFLDLLRQVGGGRGGEDPDII